MVPASMREHRVGRGLSHLQLPAGEHEHALDLRLFARASRPPRASAPTRPGGRSPRDRGPHGRLPRQCRAPSARRPAWSGRVPRAMARRAGGTSRRERAHTARIARSAAVQRSGVRSRAGCGCGGCASSSSGRCSSTVAARSSPAPAPGAGCGRSRSGTSAAAGSPLIGAAGRACACSLRRLDARGGARLDLRLTRVRTRDIRALCAVLPAGVSPAGRPLELETRLRLRDRGVTGRSPCASAGAACATARASSPGSGPSSRGGRSRVPAWPCA